MRAKRFHMVAVLAVVGISCSSNSPSGNEGTGGATSSTGGATSGTGGATVGTGGRTSSTGGATTSTGGSITSTGGSVASTGGTTTGSGGGAGGAASGTGGASSVGAGGATSKTGGAVGGVGGSGTGGAGGTNVGTGGSTVGGTSGANPSAGCGKAPTAITSSQYNKGTTIPITAAGLQRRYVLNVPTNYDNSHPYTLVVTIHARDGNDIQMFNWQYYGLLPQSNNTAIFAAPNGQMNGAPCSGTGVGESGCGWPNPNGQDMALMDAVVAQVEENFCVDTNHIYATGWSYGASMSYEVGCERPLGGTTATWGVRAIAVYSAAQMSGSCKPSTSHPVAYYASHGTHDSVLGYSGGVSLAQNWSNADGCTWQTPTSVTSGAHACTKMAGCKSGYPVEFCSFNGDHTPFPDTGQSAGSWGPAEVWTFFSQF